MSCNAHRFIKRNQHLCPCGAHALYFSPASQTFRFRPDHPLCLRCYRSLAESNRQRGKRTRVA